MHTALALLCACTISSSILMLQAKEDPAIQTETSRPMPAMPKRPVEKKTTDSEKSTDNGFASNTQESVSQKKKRPKKCLNKRVNKRMKIPTSKAWMKLLQPMFRRTGRG